jgi:hypothetical protein
LETFNGRSKAKFLVYVFDRYVIWENMERLLRKQNCKYCYLGFKHNHRLPRGHNGGGAGYLLNTATVKLMFSEGKKHPDVCKEDGATEDLDIAR